MFFHIYYHLYNFILPVRKIFSLDTIYLKVDKVVLFSQLCRNTAVFLISICCIAHLECGANAWHVEQALWSITNRR